MEVPVLEPGFDAHFFLLMSLLITGEAEKNITLAPKSFVTLPRALNSLLTDLRLLVATVPT